MAHLQTPPRQSSSSRAKTYGLVTPSTPHHLSSRYNIECPDAPYLPANFFPLPPLRTSPRTKKGDPSRPSTTTHVRTRTVTGDRGTLLQPGMPPTPAETPVQKRRREQEMKQRIEEGTSTTSRRLFPLKAVTEDTKPPPFEIFTDSMHRTPMFSPNNPFAPENITKEPTRGLSPRKRRRDAEERVLGPHEMYYTFRGKRFARKIPPGPNGESWRDTMKPVRLFQKEIEEQEGRRRKRRRIASEEVEEVDTEEEGDHFSGDDQVDDMPF